MLQTKDFFPPLTFALAGGGEIRLPSDLAGGYGVILFYRGAFSDTCVAQLRAFAQASAALAAAGIGLVAVSADDEQTTRGLIGRYGLTFPVAYAADPRQVSAVTGILVSEDSSYLDASGFVIDPDGLIHTAIYSSTEGFEERIVTIASSIGSIGRLMPDEVLRAVAEAKSRA